MEIDENAVRAALIRALTATSVLLFPQFKNTRRILLSAWRDECPAAFGAAARWHRRSSQFMCYSGIVMACRRSSRVPCLKMFSALTTCVGSKGLGGRACKPVAWQPFDARKQRSGVTLALPTKHLFVVALLTSCARSFLPLRSPSPTAQASQRRNALGLQRPLRRIRKYPRR